ncbi:MAG: bifunctional glutamate N-acetyltransferase/amino-acid acetyltransferase ArgJ [Planktomarina sp.]
MTVSPLAPKSFPILPTVAGVRFATAQTGLKYKNRPDVMLAVMDEGTSVAGVFTTSKTCSAAVDDCRAKLSQAAGPVAILVNAGNANAFTGAAGRATVAEISTQVATATGVPQSRVYTASTGVIGEVLEPSKITSHLADLANDLSSDGLPDAAKAICTTDTFPKGATKTIEVNGQSVQIAGIAKGSGMIAPDMATMLAYVFTDAQIAQPDLQNMTARLCAKTFNAVTVDSDTSTSDTLMVCATGKSGADVTQNVDFEAALHTVLLDLAHQIVRDGEGATKFVEVRVTGAASDTDAEKIARSIANSPLVKTAIAGEDPNWGRIVMAVGKSGVAADRDKLSISFGDILVATKGWVDPDYSEEKGASYMKNEELVITADLGLGNGTAVCWTCDLTHGYITINADYRS